VSLHAPAGGRAVLTVSGRSLGTVSWTARRRNEAGRQQPRAGQVMTSDVLIGDAVCGDPAWLRIADAITCPARRAASETAECLREVLWLYPGCAVAVVEPARGECVAAARGEVPRRLTIRQDDAGPGQAALLCAVFVHGWLAAGQPLAALDQARLRAALCGVPASEDVRPRHAVVSFSLMWPANSRLRGLPRQAGTGSRLPPARRPARRWPEPR
jgi:hypothetical protein